jgi:hypothetical protein
MIILSFISFLSFHFVRFTCLSLLFHLCIKESIFRAQKSSPLSANVDDPNDANTNKPYLSFLNKVETEKQKQKQKSKQNLRHTLCTMFLHYLEEKRRIGKTQGQSFVPILRKPSHKQNPPGNSKKPEHQKV